MQESYHVNRRNGVLFNGTVHVPSSKMRKEKRLLPRLKFLHVIPGAFVFEDGGIRQILECDSIMPFFDSNLCDKVESVFADLLRATSCDLQLIVQCRSVDITEKRRQFLFDRRASHSDYFDWYSDYYLKWIERVSDLYDLPARRHFVVITYHCSSTLYSSKSKAMAKADQERLSKFKLEVEVISKALRDCQLKPRPLGELEVNRLFMSELHELNSPSERLEEANAAPIDDTQLLEPSFAEESTGLQIGSDYHISRAMLIPPATGWFGMMSQLMLVTVPYTVSVHFRRVNQAPVHKLIQGLSSEKNTELISAVLSGSEKVLGLSMYFSTSGHDRATASKRMKELKDLFAGVKRGNETRTIPVSVRPVWGSQLKAWRSTMPLGLDSCAMTNTVSGEFAATFFPFMSEKTSDNNQGFVLGFSLASRELCVVDAVKSKNVMVSAENALSASKLTSFLLFRFLCLGHNCLVIGNSSTLSFMSTIVGKQKCLSLTGNAMMHDEKESFLTVVDPGIDPLDADLLNRLQRMIDDWSSMDNKIICIEDLSRFTCTSAGIEFVENLFSSAQKSGVRIILGTTYEDLDNVTFKSIEKYCHHKIVLPSASWDTRQISKQLSVPRDLLAHCFKNHAAISICDGNASRVHLVWTPMDHWIFLLDPKHETQIEPEKRNVMISTVKKNNPKLVESDAFRQAVYYLGIDKDYVHKFSTDLD